MPKTTRRNNLQLYKDFLTGWNDENSLGMTTNFVIDTWSASTWKELFQVLGKYGFSTGDVDDSTIDLCRGEETQLAYAISKNLKIYGHYLTQEKGYFESYEESHLGK